MSHDFAKQRSEARGKHKKPQRAATRNVEVPDNSHWGWFVSGIFCGFLIVGIGYLGVIRLDDEIAAATAQAQNDQGGGTRPVIDYDFYKELANAEIEVDGTLAPGIGDAPGTGDESTAGIVVDTTRWSLQAGSFQNRREAENRLAEVILLNMDASIVPGVVTGRTWYRVMVGPFEGRRMVDRAQSTLSENNINSYVIRMVD